MTEPIIQMCAVCFRVSLPPTFTFIYFGEWKKEIFKIKGCREIFGPDFCGNYIVTLDASNFDQIHEKLNNLHKITSEFLLKDNLLRSGK